ncbi:DolP-mannose mannosyltransferase [Halocatena salina]|uniref:DolP-mannose mannosyltransferase n=1 Tax=Halocatena salina TaxID=2934340 RepID=A0A8U0A2V4_9EURY|nr:DolP-mannose mannosyltransferase [Halocatena salina]UPM42333.1 DolP-mannose mannosyltransferase [Halocatena salina]
MVCDWEIIHDRATSSARIGRFVLRHRYVILTLVYVAVHLWLFVTALPITGRPSGAPDPITFELGGQFLATGRIPYVDLFDIKPPLVHLIPGILATGIHFLGSPGFGYLDALVLHTASVLLTLGMTLVALFLITDLVDDITDDRLAALAAGFVPLTCPIFYMAGIGGFRPKTMALVAGLLSVRWLSRQRWLWAGLAAACAPALWQFGLVFPLFAVGIAHRSGRTALKRVLAGGAIITTVTLAPFALNGIPALRAILVEVVLLPFVVRPVREPTGTFSHVTRLISYLGWEGFCVLLVGTVGALLYPIQRRFRASTTEVSELSVPDVDVWVAIVVGVFSIQAMVVDGRGLTDSTMWVGFASVGVGLLIAQLNNRRFRQLFVVGIVVIGIVAFLTDAVTAFYGWRWVTQPEASYKRVATVYWHTSSIDTCHIRRAGDERTFVRLMGGSLSDQVCGQYSIDSMIRSLIP